MKFEQGNAPAVAFDGKKILFTFKGRKLETNDKDLQKILIKRGAIAIDAEQEQEEKVKEPAWFSGLTKPEMSAKAAEMYGVAVSVNQSRADMIEEIIALAAKAEAGEDTGTQVGEGE